MRSNLVLAVILAVIGSFAWWYEFQSKPERQRKEDATTKLVAVDPAREAGSVRIVDKEKSVDLTLECSASCKPGDANGKWEITSPIKFKADEGNVGSFINSIASAHVTETVPLEGDADQALAKFGLGKAARDLRKVILSYKARDKDPAADYTVYLGDASAVGDNIYAYVTGPGAPADRLRIVPGYLKNNLQRNLSYWRAKRVLDFAASEVEEVALTNPAGAFELRREQSNWFVSDKRGKRLADSESVDTFLTGLVFMNAQEYLSDDKKKDWGKLKLPSKAKYSLRVRTSRKPPADGGEPVVFDVYETKDKTPKLYATRSDRNYVVELDRPSTEKFGKKSDDFRIKTLLTAAEKQVVRKVSLKIEGKEFGFESDEGVNWRLVAGTIDGFDKITVDQALAKLGGLRVAEFLGRKPVPPGNKELSAWTLKEAGGKTVRAITVYGTSEKGEYYSRVESELVKLERGPAGSIPWKVAEFTKQPQPAAGAPAPSGLPLPDDIGKALPIPSHGPDDGHGH